MDERPKKVKKKKKKKIKKVKKRVLDTDEDEDTLSAFGITPRDKKSRYKAAAGLDRRPLPDRDDDGPEIRKKVKKKKKKRIVKKVVRKVIKKPKVEDRIPVAKPPKGEALEERPKKGGLRNLLKTKKTEEPATGVAKPVKKVKEEKPDELDLAEELLDDIDLDSLSESLEVDLLEKFEEKIDHILEDIIDEEVDDLTEADTAVKESVKERPVEVEIPAHAKDGRTEVEARPELKLEAEVEGPTKDTDVEEPIVLEKEETKMVSEKTKAPVEDKEEVKETAPTGIKIEDGDVRERRVAYKVAHNFEKLPPNMRNELLRTLSKVDDPRVREDVVSAITTHFKNLPPEIQKLLTNLARDDVTRVREEVVFEIQRNFDKISTKIKERILKALAKDKEPSVREEVVATICQHYDNLSDEVKDLLKALAKDKVRSVRDELSFEMAKADSPVPKSIREEVMDILKGRR